MRKITDIIEADGKTIYCHPNNYDLLKSQIKQEEDPYKFRYRMDFIRPFGLEIRTDPDLKEYDEIWHPTSWGEWCELEYSDEKWARPLGLGRIEKRPVFFIMDSLRTMMTPFTNFCKPMTMGAGLEAHKEWESYEIIDHEPTTHTWPYVEIGIQSKEEYELAVEKAKQDAIKRNEARDKNLYLELKAKFENVS